MFKTWVKIAAILAVILFPIVITAIYHKSALTIYRSLVFYPKEIAIATGPVGGLYRKLSEDIARTIEAELPVKVRLIDTKGSLENLELLQNGDRNDNITDRRGNPFVGKVDFAMYQPGTLGVLKKDDTFVPKHVSFVTKMYSQPAHLIVRADSGITSPAELRGMTVQLGLVKSGDYAMSKILLEHFFGLEGESAVTGVHCEYSDVVKGLRDGTLDAAFITVGIQAKVFDELFASDEFVLREIPTTEALTKKNISLSHYTIPKGIYRMQPRAVPDEDISTVALGAQLLTHQDVHDGLVKDVTRLVLNEDFLNRNNLGELKQGGITFAQEEPEFAMHPGAGSVYEAGFDIHIVESYDAIYSLVASVLIAAFLLTRSFRRRQARKKEHKLDRHMHSLLEIERRQLTLDSDSEANDLAVLQQLLDEVTFMRQGALQELAAHELNEDRATDSFVQMCHALSSKINAKISRQRLDKSFSELADALARTSEDSQNNDEKK